MTDIQLIKPRITELGGELQVRRLLPHAQQRAVGPFIFFDHFGPVTLAADSDSDIRAHPHIGLATVSYLFEGQLLHRDSLGSLQLIAPGAINWMTAGSGIVHSERTPENLRHEERRLHGLQLWVALPEQQQDCEPAFQHVAADALPQFRSGDATLRLLVGTAFGFTSPVRAAGPTIYLDIGLPAGGRFVLPPLAQELAIYSPLAPLEVNGGQLPEQQLGVLDDNMEAEIRATTDLRFVVIGGERLASPRYIWWNFVSTDPGKIAAAAERWDANRFPAIAGDNERAEMPDWSRLRR